MKIDGFGVTLTRLSFEDLEEVREWRNSEAVNRHMLYQDPISTEMQVRWFSSLKPDSDYYFVVNYAGKRCGIVNLKSVDLTKGTAEAGIFIKDEFQGDDLSLRAIVALSDFGFKDLDLKLLTARVRPENVRALRFNERLGYRVVGRDEASGAILIELKKSDYEIKTAKFRKYLSKG